MTWIVDIELVGVDVAEPPDALTVTLDVIFPGETWCRSVVFVAPEEARTDRDEIIRSARDALVAVIESEGEPVSVELRLSPRGADVIAIGRPG